MSKRNEIKRKQEIQTNLKLQFNKIDQRVLSWLEPNKKNKNANAKDDNNNLITESERNIEYNVFKNQVIIPVGKGLNLTENSDTNSNEKNITIGQFINENDDNSNKNGDKKNKISDMKRREVHNSSLRSLQNKLRDDNRGKVNKVPINNKFNNKKLQNEIKVNDSNRDNKGNESDSDSDDDDDEVLARKSKGIIKSKNNSKRPF